MNFPLEACKAAIGKYLIHASSSFRVSQENRRTWSETLNSQNKLDPTILSVRVNDRPGVSVEILTV